MVWRMDDPQGNEAGKIKWEIVQYTRGRGLDLGCGPSKPFAHFIGVDDYTDSKIFGIPMRPDVAADCTKLDVFADASMDFVFSSHLLEHIEDYEAALRVWWSKIKVGGYLVLYLPHRDLYPRIGQPGSNPDHKHDFEPADIRRAMSPLRHKLGAWDLLVEEVRQQGQEYSFLMVFRKLEPGGVCGFFPDDPPTGVKRACVVRYGGFGDMLQAAAILPELKRQGFHVTMMTTPKGQDILRHDPHIDAWYIQDEGQVPNHELHDFWNVQAAKFDKFIQLSESVEGTLLAMPGRANHGWPSEIRHRYMNRNYGEFTAELAGVPFRPEGEFYPTGAERDAALAYLDAIGFGGKFLVVFPLAGSSRHKFYPGQDEVIQGVLDQCPDARFVLTGDDACKILEVGWEHEPRVAMESGELPIRSVLALAQFANVVLGPETGVLNSVAYDENVLKIVLLSHSSIENLTKQWANCVPIVPFGVKCYPCHQLHYTAEYCPQDQQTGAAICQQSIDPQRIVKKIVEAYRMWSIDRAARRKEAA